MTLLDYITLATMFLGGVICGAFYYHRIVMRNVSDNPRKMIEILEKIDKLNQLEETKEQRKENNETDIKTEIHHGVTYLFDKDTDEFLAQGATFADALDIASKRFPNRFSAKIVIPDSQSS